MFRNAYQRGRLTIFFSAGSKPLYIWDTCTKNGYITRFLDDDIKSMVLEIGGTNVSTTYMICPKGNTVLGITMPFLVMIVKNLQKYFSFEVTILDETGTRRRFRASNFQSSTQILPLCTVLPIGLSEGWNQIQFNLAEFTKRAYKKQFIEVQKLKINANIRLRRIYFAERLVAEDELPPEYRLFFPLASKGPKKKKAIEIESKDKENIDAAPSPAIKTEEAKPDEAKGSKTDVKKAGSRVSIQSAKKTLSKQGSLVQVMEEKPEGDIKLVSKTSLVDIPAAVEEVGEGGEEAPATGEEAPPTGEEAPPTGEEDPPTGEEAVQAGEEVPPANEETPLTEEAPAAEEAPPPEGEASAPTPEPETPAPE